MGEGEKRETKEKAMMKECFLKKRIEQNLAETILEWSPAIIKFFYSRKS